MRIRLLHHATAICAIPPEGRDGAAPYAALDVVTRDPDGARPYAPFLSGFAAVAVSNAICVCATTRCNRGAFHRLLGQLGRSDNAEEEAAAISGLVSSTDPATALALASRLFRELPASQLLAEDLASTGLAAASAFALGRKTRPARLGEVSCFVSHSWSDEKQAPGAKHAAIRRWAARHEAASRREATLWLDKACIAQDNIDQSLSCLPVFLAGCEKLLVVAGPTYVTRLWCVMELFTFFQMGGSLARLEVVPIVGRDKAGSDEVAATRALHDKFARFDAAQAQCFKHQDQQRLLAVIEAAFGDFTVFNAIVRGALADGRGRNDANGSGRSVLL